MVEKRLCQYVDFVDNEDLVKVRILGQQLKRRPVIRLAIPIPTDCGKIKYIIVVVLVQARCNL